MIFLTTLLALTILSPQTGETVSILKDAQKAYLSERRDERFLQMESPADRTRFLAVGNRQKPLRIAWEDAGAVVRVSLAPCGTEPTSIVVTNRSELWVTNLELDRDYVVQVSEVEEEGISAEARFRTEATPPRLLRAEGVSNFRDLGGWRTQDGKVVRQNLIFRSAGLRSSSKTEGGFFRQKVVLGPRRVTDAGIETLKTEFAIRTDLELRTPQETAGMNGTLLGSAQWVEVSFAAYDFIGNTVRGKEPFAKIFKVFTQRENYPILMHCSGGRDRTGTLAFLLNGLLGVSEEDLYRDWEMSIFSDDGAGFSPGRIKSLSSYLSGFSGETLKDRIEVYVRSCGVSDEEIRSFREIMLEEEPK